MPSAAPSADITPPKERTPIRVLVEAEDGALTRPMRAEPESGASGGLAVVVPNGSGFNPDSARGPGPGTVDLAFSVPESGQYRIWARVIAPDVGSNSLFLSVDDGPELLWDVPGPGIDHTAATWTWTQAADLRTLTVQTWELAAGEHRVRLGNREDGTWIDAIAVTSGPDWDQPPG